MSEAQTCERGTQGVVNARNPRGSKQLDVLLGQFE